MDVRFLAAVVAVALGVAIALPACRPQAPDTPQPPQDTQAESRRQALLQQAEAYRRDAQNIPVLTPQRKMELRQLAAEVRAWQGRTGRDHPRVSQETVKAARQDNTPGGGDGCGDCPGYTVDGDRICFLESEGECPVDDGEGLGFGRVCVYTCIWIGAQARPARTAQ